MARPLVLRMDPNSPGTSERVERVVERIGGVRERTQMLSKEMAELAGRFVDDELVEPSGPKQGESLGRRGRVQWLSQLLRLHRSYCAVGEEEAELQALLRRMEESIGSSSSPRPGVPDASARPPQG